MESRQCSHIYRGNELWETAFTFGNEPHQHGYRTMPILRLEMHPGRTPEQRRDFVREVTRVTVEVLKCPPESVDVVMYEVPREQWAKAGKLVSEMQAMAGGPAEAAH